MQRRALPDRSAKQKATFTTSRMTWISVSASMVCPLCAPWCQGSYGVWRFLLFHPGEGQSINPLLALKGSFFIASVLMVKKSDNSFQTSLFDQRQVCPNPTRSHYSIWPSAWLYIKLLVQKDIKQLHLRFAHVGKVWHFGDQNQTLPAKLCE